MENGQFDNQISISENPGSETKPGAPWKGENKKPCLDLLVGQGLVFLI